MLPRDLKNLRTTQSALDSFSARITSFVSLHLRVITLSCVTLLALFALLNAPSAPTKMLETIKLSTLEKETEAEAARISAQDKNLVKIDELVRVKTFISSLATDESKYNWLTVTVKRRDTLSQIFKRNKLSIDDAVVLSKLKGAAPLHKIRPKEKIRLALNEQREVMMLRYQMSQFSTLSVDKKNDLFIADVVTRIPQIKLRREHMYIDKTVVDAAEDAGVDFAVVAQFAEIFGWQVDFTRQIRKGDRFSIIYEELFMDGKKVGNGDILAAELNMRENQLRAIHYKDEQGRSAYYAPNGESVQRSFLRSPIKFGRVTSNFSRKRFHPILKKWKAHKGVDYGAPIGTPIRATGDGVVTEARSKQGYGNTIVLRHASKYTTLYAHMSSFARGMKRGKKVRQGQVIGYVGSTGWSTGPHLHYEFRIAGVHRNPLTVKLPKSAPIAKQYQSDFLKQANYWGTQLEQIGIGPLAQINP